MTRRIGWYVHHHGRGHLTRFLAIAPHLPGDVQVVSTLPPPSDLPRGCRWLRVPRDDEAEDGADPRRSDPTVGGLLHWAPRGHAGHRERLAAIARLIAEQRPDVFVVDVSVEVTLLARMLGVPTVAFTQPGERDDEAHRLGFRAADTVIAPWPAGAVPVPHLAQMAEKVVHTGGISRFDGRGASGDRGDEIVLLTGAGGADHGDEHIAAAAADLGRPWRVLGGDSWVDDPWPALTEAAVVVAWAGQNSVADLAAARAPAIVIPQRRPFGEQHATAGALRRLHLAVVRERWPAASDWPALLERAAVATPDWDRWQVAGAARRAAEAILRTAGGTT
ncbi:hypothetical protein [Microbacterium telephonicum]|uniref:Putative glycosyltransferase n=1 Tax=Microbacterium telephonicum TaxID=1714841 RepID=A0A498CKM8_9MICO|nr:hypothetical protein [Microbacterium telephonicum]RLK52568.1 putative glycosyltransferase [Microbacterium telephonicum]